MNRLKNKVAIVTGAGRVGNIGLAICDAFLREGATGVVATDMRSEQAEEITAAMKAAHGEGRFRFVEHDATDEAAWNRLLEETAATYGGLDVLVNEARFVTGASIYHDGGLGGVF